jgi:hypothetical protein
VSNFGQEINFIRKIYRDILEGFTPLNLSQKKINVKHLTEKELSETNEVYLNEYKEAKRAGLLTEKDKIELLNKDNLWSKEKEDEILNLNNEISLKKKTLAKLFIQSQIKDLKKEIKDKEEALKKIEKEREEILGLTVENFAFKKSNQYIIYLCIYNEDMTKMFNDLEEFGELDEIKLSGLIFIYKEFMDMFNVNNIKKIAVSPFFMNSFFLCEDNAYSYYGKPIINLTKNQIDLFSIAKNYKHYLIKAEDNPPENLQSLEELVGWYENRPNLSNLKEKNKDKMGQSYIGATKEELINIASNSKDEVVDLASEAQKSGGDLSFEDILKIHGI